MTHIAIRPITGTLDKNPRVRVNINRGTKLTCVGPGLFEIYELGSVKLSPPTLSYKKIRVKLNPYIAATDLEETC